LSILFLAISRTSIGGTDIALASCSTDGKVRIWCFEKMIELYYKWKDNPNIENWNEEDREKMK
jgi:hypothetical protein